MAASSSLIVRLISPLESGESRRLCDFYVNQEDAPVLVTGVDIDNPLPEDLAQLLAQSKGLCTILIPGDLCRQINVPGVASGNRGAQTLVDAYIDDSIATARKGIHVAYGEHPRGGISTIALAIDSEQIQAIVDLVQSATACKLQIFRDVDHIRFSPDQYCYTHGQRVVVQEDGRLLALSTALDHYLQQGTIDPPDHAATLAALEHTLPDNDLEHWFPHALELNADAINLAQGPFQSAHKLLGIDIPVAIVGASILCCLLVANSVFWAIGTHYRHNADAIASSNKALFMQTFPREKKVVNIVTQTLNQLEAPVSSDRNAFQRLFVPVFSQQMNPSIEAIVFRSAAFRANPPSLEMEFSGDSAAALNTLFPDRGDSSLEVITDSVTQFDGGYIGSYTAIPSGGATP